MKLPKVPDNAKNNQSFLAGTLMCLTKKKTATEPANTSLNEASCIGLNETNPRFMRMKALPQTNPKNNKTAMVLASNFTLKTD